MVSLTMMARLLEAVRPSARLVLVGDPDQLSSVEAGAVLADIARAPADRTQTLGGSWSTSGLSQPAHRRLYTALCSSPTPGGSAVPSTLLPGQSAPPTPMRQSRYFALAQAMCSFAKLILNLAPAEASAAALAGMAAQIRSAGVAMYEAARSGDARGARRS